MAETKERDTRGSPTEQFAVIIVQDDADTREKAARFCRQLIDLHGAGTEFHFQWWSGDRLVNSTDASEAVAAAARANMVVLALLPEGDVPAGIKQWIEHWLRARGEREGVLVGLMENEPDPCSIACLKEVYLRRIAHRAGMDYLSHVPRIAPHAIPDSLDSYNERAGQMTAVLDEILHTQPQRTPAPL
jgi:hypothetical protein